MPGTTSSVPAPNYQTTGSIGIDQFAVGATPGTQRAHIKSTVNEVSLLVEQTAVAPANDVVVIQTNASTDTALGIKIPADTNDRLKTTTAGVISWGPGNATQDTNLYRGSSGTLQTDSVLNANKTTDASAFTATYTVTNTNNAAYKQTANAATGKFLESAVTGDTTARFTETADGKMNWGPGNAAQDTNLFRQTTNTLRTDNSLQVGTNLTVTGTTTLAGVVMPTSTFGASDHGLTAWTYDPALVANGTTSTSGTVYLMKLVLRYSATINKVMLSITNAASGVTANQNFVGIYDSTGSRLAVTTAGSIDAGIASSGVLTATLSTSPTLAAGTYWIGFVNNATTPVQLGRMGSFASTPNANLSQANYRFAVNGTSQTSLPSSITPSSNTSTGSITAWGAILP